MWSKLTVDMTKRTAAKDTLDAAWHDLGGRALIAQYMLAKVPPVCRALGPLNDLLFCNSTFAGTGLDTGDFLSVGSKSPITGGIKQSRVGGTLGTFMANHGLRMIAVTGKGADGALSILHIGKNGIAKLVDAQDCKDMNTYDFVDAMRKKFGDKISVASVGVGGERCYKAASIQVTDLATGYPSRAAARGGLGAVMGAKGLKGIVIEEAEKKFSPPYADEKKAKEIIDTFNTAIRAAAEVSPMHLYGTIATIEKTGDNAGLPVENFSGDYFPEYKKVGVEAFMTNLLSRGGCNKQACMEGCPVKCSNIYNGPDKQYLTSGLEYDTVALFGPNCLISDLDKIARMDRVCDEVGVDPVEIADACAVAMEQKKIPWGDADAVLGLLEEMKKGTDFGRVLGDGCEAVGLHLGSKRIPTVKHMAMSGFDPRNIQGVGVTYATSPQGPDAYNGLTMGAASFGELVRPAQAYASNKLQVAMTIANSTTCMLAFGALVPSLGVFDQLMAACFGGEASPLRASVDLGVKALLTERGFNMLAGIKQPDADQLPDFFLTEQAKATGATFVIHPVELQTIFNF